MGLLLNYVETFSSNAGRPQIFFSGTLEKLGRTCDQIGRTLEPCSVIVRVLLGDRFPNKF